MGRARPRHLPDGTKEAKEAKDRKGTSYYGAALTGTAALALFATGGLVSAQTQPAKHLLAMGPGRATPAIAKPALHVSKPALHSPKPAVHLSKAAAHVGEATLRTVVHNPAPVPAPTTTTTRPPIPRVLSITPPMGAKNVGPMTTLMISLSSPPVPGAPMPSLDPAVAGVWSVRGSTVRFTPMAGYVPWATEVLTVPAALARHQRSEFTVQGVGTLRAQQLLAELKYLPLRFGTTPTQSSLDLEAAVPALVSPDPQRGSFTWRYPNIPAPLSALWSRGQYGVITEGAIMTFENDMHLPVDGVMGPVTWKALAAAIATRAIDPAPYDYLMISELVPEQLVVWRNGKVIYKTPVNTGVQGANTPVGTWPVYLRFISTTMIGTDVDGAHYDVTGVPWVAYFNGGDAVHGYWRYSYGYPQSNGCVELPVSNAQVVWPMDPLGTLVNVSD